MAKGGRYCEVYNTHFRHQSPDDVLGEGFLPEREELVASGSD